MDTLLGICSREAHTAFSPPAGYAILQVFFRRKAACFPKKDKNKCGPLQTRLQAVYHTSTWNTSTSHFSVFSKQCEAAGCLSCPTGFWSQSLWGTLQNASLIKCIDLSHFITNKQKAFSDTPRSKPFSMMEAIFWLNVSLGLLCASVSSWIL